MQRYVFALTADSQHKLNELWAPPAMDVGKNYAKLLKAVSLNITLTPTLILPLPLPLTPTLTITLTLLYS